MSLLFVSDGCRRAKMCSRHIVSYQCIDVNLVHRNEWSKMESAYFLGKNQTVKGNDLFEFIDKTLVYAGSGFIRRILSVYMKTLDSRPLGSVRNRCISKRKTDGL